MTSPRDLFRALPESYRKTAFQVLCSARRRRKDGWPTLPAIVKAARSAGVRADRLAAMFGFVALPYKLKNAVAFRDTMRGADVSPNHVYDARLRPFYEFFRAAVAADDEPMDKRRPHYSDEAAPSSA